MLIFYYHYHTHSREHYDEKQFGGKGNTFLFYS